MLSLFKDAEIPLHREEALTQARRLLVSSLNKGMIPSWDQFFQELPVLSNVEDLESIKENFVRLTQWPFLADMLNLDATEFFFHSFDKSQRLTLNGKKIDLLVELHSEHVLCPLHRIPLA